MFSDLEELPWSLVPFTVLRMLSSDYENIQKSNSILPPLSERDMKERNMVVDRILEK